MKELCYLSTGSNLGDRQAYLASAIEALEREVGLVVAQSPVYETDAWGKEDQPAFLNQVLGVQTSLSAEELLNKCLGIEANLGRERKEYWGERTIDIDILFYGSTIVEKEHLQIPHPRLQNRRFVLKPLSELNDQFVHPVLLETVGNLLNNCQDLLEVRLIDKIKKDRNYMQVANGKHLIIEGNIGAGKTSLSHLLKEELNGELILEEFADNPFLPLFYQDAERYGFPVELFFMTERHKQLKTFWDSFDPSQYLVSDYIFSKTLLFASQNLEGDELSLFRRIFTTLDESFPKPDLLIYLHRPVEVLLRNIKKRNRSYEQDITAEYLLKIERGYFSFFETIKEDCAVLVLEAEELDFIQNPEHYQLILNQLEKQYSPGIHYWQFEEINV